MPFSFKEASTADKELLLKWTKELMAHESVDEDLELPLVDNIDEKLEQWLENLLIDPNCLLIIASDKRLRPAGLIIAAVQAMPNDFTPLEAHGLIQMVWVDPEFRQQGLAKELVLTLEKTFEEMGIPYCEIQYSSVNVEAAIFWKKLGYQVVSYNARKFFKS